MCTVVVCMCTAMQLYTCCVALSGGENGERLCERCLLISCHSGRRVQGVRMQKVRGAPSPPTPGFVSR